MTHRTFNLHDHLSKEHKISPFQTYLKEIVYGGTDGIVTTFAVVAGFAGANALTTFPQFPLLTVLLFGFANLFADAASMGLGNFLSVRSEQDVYTKEEAKEYYEVKHHKDMEKEETRAILMIKGFTQEQATTLTDIYATNDTYWVDWMMDNELELPNPKGENPLLTGFATFLSFITFGLIPLLPYVFASHLSNLFTLSCMGTFTALVLLGLLRWRVTNISLLRSVVEIVVIGSVAASIAYMVGTFFNL